MAPVISPKAKQDPNLGLLQELFHINSLNFDEAGLSPAYKLDLLATYEMEEFHQPSMAITPLIFA